MTADPKIDVQAHRRIWVDALYRKHSQALTRFLIRQRFSPQEAADIVQETYCRMHQVPDIESITFPKAFLFRVANNLARNTEKQRRLGIEQGGVDTETIDVETSEPGPYRMLKGEQELAVVHRALRELSPKCRRVFVMNRFENLSYAEIARELQVSVSMIEKYVSQALAHLKACLAAADSVPAARRSAEAGR